MQIFNCTARREEKPRGCWLCQLEVFQHRRQQSGFQAGVSVTPWLNTVWWSVFLGNTEFWEGKLLLLHVLGCQVALRWLGKMQDSRRPSCLLVQKVSHLTSLQRSSQTPIFQGCGGAKGTICTQWRRIRKGRSIFSVRPVVESLNDKIENLQHWEVVLLFYGHFLIKSSGFFLLKIQ